MRKIDVLTWAIKGAEKEYQAQRKGNYVTKDDVLRSMYQRNMQECRQAIEELLDIASRTKANEEM